MGLSKVGNQMKHLYTNTLSRESSFEIMVANNFCVNLMANSKDLHKICVAVRTAQELV
jgi:hypothetical protein